METDASSNQENPPLDAPPDLNALADEVRQILGSMLPLLSFEAKLDSSVENDCVRIRVECQDAGRLIGRRGSTVNEIQFLLNRILQRKHKTVPRIFLDVNGGQPQETASNEILDRVRSLAAQVRRWGEAANVAPLNAADRKAVEEMFARDHELEVVPIETRGGNPEMQKMRIQLKQKT
ncbi:MAG: KH domain-containing protein [Verrucomicrobia bacterium]|nr:KH domain-containing protein [Verrucomicrobiota bacterium]